MKNSKFGFVLCTLFTVVYIFFIMSITMCTPSVSESFGGEGESKALISPPVQEQSSVGQTYITQSPSGIRQYETESSANHVLGTILLLSMLERSSYHRHYYEPPVVIHKYVPAPIVRRIVKVESKPIVSTPKPSSPKPSSSVRSSPRRGK
jgi:hypothetical protein